MIMWKRLSLFFKRVEWGADMQTAKAAPSKTRMDIVRHNMHIARLRAFTRSKRNSAKVPKPIAVNDSRMRLFLRRCYVSLRRAFVDASDVAMCIDASRFGGREVLASVVMSLSNCTIDWALVQVVGVLRAETVFPMVSRALLRMCDFMNFLAILCILNF